MATLASDIERHDRDASNFYVRGVVGNVFQLRAILYEHVGLPVGGVGGYALHATRMAELLWTKASTGEQLPDGTSLPAGKRVCMLGRRYGTSRPGQFDLLRVYSPMVRAGARAAGRPQFTQRARDVWTAHMVGKDEARSDPLSLQASRFSGTQRWRFTDRTDFSSVVRTTRFADVFVRGRVRTTEHLPGVLEIEAGVTVPTGLNDPVLALSLVLPGEAMGDGRETVEDILLQELTDDGELDDRLYEAVRNLNADSLRSGAAAGWEFGLSDERIDVDPGSTARVRIRVAARESGALAFAVQALGLGDARGERAVSNVVVVEGDRLGAMTLRYAERRRQRSDGE